VAAMTVMTLQQIEAPPEGYPEDPYLTMSDEAAAFLATAWQRIESYIAWRYSVRDVQWTVEGCGDWLPPLKPATIETVEQWRNEAWEAATVPPSPLGGYCLPGGTYRLTGTCGPADVPEIVAEAVKRLAEHMAATTGANGAGLRTENIDGVWSGEFDSRAKARALVDSGAADLLRNYRRA
jgi:hypothetical protein